MIKDLYHIIFCCPIGTRGEQGLFIKKSPDHVTGGYMIVNESNIIQAGEHQGLSLKEVEKYLEE